MHIIDTNVVVRIMLDRDDAQTHQAKAIMTAIVEGSDDVVLTTLVIGQIIFVMNSTRLYGYPREVVAQGLELFINLPNIVCQEEETVREALDIFQSNASLEFVDCYLLAYHHLYGGHIYTLDKKLRKKSL